MEDVNQIAVQLDVKLPDAILLTQLAAKLPIEQGLPLFEYLKGVLTPIIDKIEAERQKDGDKVEDEQNEELN